MAFANLGDALPDINNIEDQSAAGTKVFTACKLSANIAACFGKEFTGFPDTIYELIQGYNVKVWEAWMRHVEPVDMLVIVWATFQSAFKLIPWPFI